MNQSITLVTSEGVSITMSAPANEPPARVALWGDLAFVLGDREARTYHEASVVRVPADPIRGAREAAQIATEVAK